MSSSRDAILTRLRSARASAHIAEVPAPITPPRPMATQAECLDRFRAELTLLGVESFVEASPADVRARVIRMVGTQRVLAWDRLHLPYDVDAVLRGSTRASADVSEQAQAEIGVTGCDAAIAETGTLAFISAPGRSRTVSLLPPVHLAVVHPDTLVLSMGEFFERFGDQVRRATSCTFVTGPSRTADIELTLTLGIHGPGRVIVVIGPGGPSGTTCC